MKALITGVNGQAGSYLAKELLTNGYEVIGLARRASIQNYSRLDYFGIKDRITLIEGDITDPFSITQTLRKFKPTHVFNTAAQSHVHTSFNQPRLTFDVTAIGVLNLLEGIKNECPETRFLQFSSSEMFGDQFDTKLTLNPDCPQNNITRLQSNNLNCQIICDCIAVFDKKYQDENTRMNPQSPYAIAKLAGYNFTKLYRSSYNLFASNVIMFNYESPLRGENFVTQKIAKYIHTYVDKIVNGHSISDLCIPKLKLGNLDAKRDWGFCGDYMNGCRRILEHTQPDDFVLATGETHSVKEFLEEAFKLIGENWEKWVEIDNSLRRPAEVPYLCGRADKAKNILNWEPTVKFKDLVRLMVNA